jgi:hypothetical protein
LRSEEEALALVAGKAAAIRRRRAAKVISGLAAAAVFIATVAIIARPSAKSAVHVDNGPSSTTSTSTTTTTTTASDVGVTPAPESPPVGAAPLELSAVLIDAHPIVDSDIQFRVTVTDGDGSLTALSAKFMQTVELGTFASCGQPGPTSVTIDVAVPITLEDVALAEHNRWVWRKPTPIPAHMTFTATSRSGCEGEETAVDGVDLTLGFGNGPMAPHDPGDVGGGGDAYYFETADCDGILDHLEIDWGDGTATESVPVGIYGCGPLEGPIITEHNYAASGTYTITTTSVSTDDQGGSVQRSSTSTREATVPP